MILLRLLGATPAARGVLALLAALALLLGAFHAGRWKERTDQRARAAEARLGHITDARETEHEIETMGDDDLGSELDERLSSGRR